MNAINGFSNQNALSSLLGGAFGASSMGARTVQPTYYPPVNYNSNASALGMTLLQSLFAPMDSLLGGWQGLGGQNGLGGGLTGGLAGGLAGGMNANSSASSLAQIAMLFQMIQYACSQMQPTTHQNYSQALAYQPQHSYAPEAPMQPQVNVAVAATEHHEEMPAPAPVQAEVAVAAAGGDGGGGSGGGDGGGGGGGGGTPVILDLNGDGKLDVGGKGGPKINFDLFGNGQTTGTEWLKKGTQDGLLVADFDGNGQIDSGRELMRNTGVNGEQGKYKNGWDKARQLFDTNHDGKLAGAELDKMQVWVDSNADGKTDPGELQSLRSRGVSEIELPPGDNLMSNFTMNGRRQMAYDYDFELAPATNR